MLMVRTEIKTNNNLSFKTYFENIINFGQT